MVKINQEGEEKKKRSSQSKRIEFNWFHGGEPGKAETTGDIHHICSSSFQDIQSEHSFRFQLEWEQANTHTYTKGLYNTRISLT